MTVYEHTFPIAAIVIVLVNGVVLGALTAWKYLAHRALNLGLFAIYLVVMLGLGWCLLLPGFKDAVTQLLKPRFIIAIDTSKSMSLTPGQGVPTRWETAQAALKMPWLQAL